MLGRSRDGADRRGTAWDLLVVGLCNPGEEYRNTRHNVGQAVVELLAERHHGRLKRVKESAVVAEVRIGSRRVALCCPQTFMNESGRAVAPIARRYGIVDPTHLVVVHDELDLPPGRIKLKSGGGLAGHNGLRSLRDHLHTVDFARVRIGVGKPPGGRGRGVDHVLSRPSKADAELIAVTVVEAADAVEAILDEGIDAAMTRFNQGPV